MKKRLLEKINRFCSYLTDWENKREYYIKEFLPQIVDYNFSGLDSEARILFLEIREETNAEEWKNIINIIIKVKEEYKSILKNNFEKPFIKLQKEYKFEGFIHTTSFENFIKIYKNKKLYSRNYLENNHINFEDIANQDVVNKQKREHDYVRFYFRPKTPTNYRNEGIKCTKSLNKKNCIDLGNGILKDEEYNKQQSANPVVMIFNYSIAQNKNSKYKQSNKINQELVNSIQELKNWDLIFAEGKYENPILKEYEKPFRMAEFLYPNFIETNEIKKIVFRSKCDKERAIQLLGNDNRFIVDTSYFCNNYLYVKDYTLSRHATSLKFIIDYNIGNQLYTDNVTLKDYKHEIIVYKGNKKINNYQNPNFNEQYTQSIFLIEDNFDWDYMCYYINNFECIRMYND